MATTFRLCTASELDLLTGLVLDWHRVEQKQLDAGATRASLGSLLEDSRAGHAWIIELGGMAVGYTVITFSAPERGGEPRAYVAALYLEPSQRGRGLGRRAHRFLQDVAAWLRVPLHAFDTDREQKHAALLGRPGAGLERRPDTSTRNAA